MYLSRGRLELPQIVFFNTAGHNLIGFEQTGSHVLFPYLRQVCHDPARTNHGSRFGLRGGGMKKKNRVQRRRKTAAWYRAEIRRIDQRIITRQDKANKAYRGWLDWLGV